MPTVEAGSATVGDAEYGGRFLCPPGPAIAMVLPGERVVLPVAPGHPVILEASPERREPGCVHFGRCGGCHYQHAAYPAQVRFKREILGGLFDAAGGVGAAEVGVHTGGEWGYRNRIRLRVEAAGGGFDVGYSLPGTNEFLPIRMCPIAAPVLWRAAQALLGQAENAVGRRWLAATAEVEFFCLPDESRLSMTLLLRASEPGLRREGAFAGFCERLREGLPELAGAGAVMHPELTRQARRGWEGAEWGAAGLAYPAGEDSYWVGRGAFFQVNRLLVHRLLTLVTAGQTGRVAWDLYAGVGLFTKALAHSFERVVAVEGGDAAAASLSAASRSGKTAKTFNAIHRPTLDFLRERVTDRERPELIVVDPPRAGVGAEGAELLVRLGAPRVIYVSCDPVTLARDLRVLTGGGYQVRGVDLVDLFPQTYHVETVVHLALR